MIDGHAIELATAGPPLFPYQPWRMRLIVPGRPVPWQRAGSFGKRRFTPKKMLNHQRRVKDIAFQVWRGRAPWPGPIGARLYFSFPLNKLVYLDDRQVFPIEVYRVHGTRTGASYIELRELSPEEAIVAPPDWARAASSAANLPTPTGVPF